MMFKFILYAVTIIYLNTDVNLVFRSTNLLKQKVFRRGYFNTYIKIV